MWIQGVDDGTKVETIKCVFKNVEGSTIPADAVVQLDDSTSTDGIRVLQTNSGGLGLAVGIADASMATSGNSQFGYVQTYGYRGTSKVWTTNSSLVVGDVLIPVAAKDYLARNDTASGLNGHFVALASLETTSASATASAKIFIRCM